MITYGLNDIASLEIDRQFVLIDKSRYTTEAYKKVLEKIDESGSIGFIINDTDNYKANEFSYTTKVYGQGNYFSDFNELKYFSKISVPNSSVIAPGPASELKIVGQGNTTVSSLDNSIIINTNIDEEYKELENKISYVDNVVKQIESSYTSFTYIHNNYQEILKGGSYISISNNVVSAYGLLSSNNFNDIIANYYTKSEIDKKEDKLYGFILQGYYNRQSIDLLLSNLKKSIVGNALPEFGTLEEISNWLAPSLSYVQVQYGHFNTNKQVYEYDDLKHMYILASKPYDKDGQYYQTNIKDSGYILSYIGYLIDDTNAIHTEIGVPVSYTYMLNGKTYNATTDITIKNGILVDSKNHPVTKNDATGIYGLIEDLKNNIGENLNNKISYLETKITYLHNQSLFNLNAYSYTSYISLSFDRYTPDDDPHRTLELRMTEADYLKPTNIISTNGLTTAYTVSDMIDYRMEWINLT